MDGMQRRHLFPGLLTVGALLVAGLFPRLAIADGSILESLEPAGAAAGSEVEVKFRIREARFPRALEFSHPGIQSLPLEAPAGPLGVNPLPASDRLRIVVAPDVPPGIYEVRLRSENGLSTSRKFEVTAPGSPLVREEEDGGRPEKAQLLPRNCVVDGRIGAAGEVDHFRVEVEAGDIVVFDLRARRLDSRLEGSLSLLDDAGRLQEGVVQGRHGGDPVRILRAESPGAVIVRLHDALWQGSADFFYRLHVQHRRPHVEFVLPSRVPPGNPTRLLVHGYNLPGGQPAEKFRRALPGLEVLEMTLEAPSTTPAPALLDRPHRLFESGFTFRVGEGDPVSSPIFIGATPHSPILEPELTSADDPLPTLRAPLDLVGQLDPRGDEDWIQFEVDPGKRYRVELRADRLGSDIDASLQLEELVPQSGGTLQSREVAHVDDLPVRKTSRLDLRHFDPALTFTARSKSPALYRVRIADHHASGPDDPRKIYHLAIHELEPDFELVVEHHPLAPDPRKNPPVPGVAAVSAGGVILLDVHLFREDGFDSPVEILVEGLPEHLTATGTTIPPGQSETRLALRASDEAQDWSGAIRFRGRATVGETVIERTARLGEVIWPAAGARGQARARGSGALAICLESRPAPFLVRPATPGEIRVIRGGKVEVPLEIHREEVARVELRVRLESPSPHVTAKEIKVPAKQETAKLEVTVDPKATPGPLILFPSILGKIPRARSPRTIEIVEAHHAELEQALANLEEKRKALPEDAPAEEVQPLEARLEAGRQEVKQVAEQLKKLRKELEPKPVDLVLPGVPLKLRIVDLPFRWKVESPEALPENRELALTVRIERESGFEGEVKVQVTGKLPDGVEVTPLKIASDREEGVLSMRLPPGKLPETLELEASARFAGQDRKERLPVHLPPPSPAPEATP